MKAIGCYQAGLYSQHQSNIKKCIFCTQENHKSQQCKIVSKPEVRKGIILSKRLCYIYLKVIFIALNVKGDSMFVFADLKR